MQTKKPWRIGTRAKLLMRGLRYSCILPYASIDGWLTVDEAITLLELAQGLPEQRPRVVEIGSWQGKSTVCIATGLRDKLEPQLVCIDPFDASGDAESADLYDQRHNALGGPLRQAFESNLGQCGEVRGFVDVRQGFSFEHADSVDEGVDMLFLDGDHSYDAVRRDFDDWANKVRPGGYLAMHDVVHDVHEGPRRVVDESVLNDPAWIDHRYVDSMFVARRAPSESPA
ncbi:MAG: class I SAM-dependent methyltransferase [Planctomycetota bacterium]